MCVFYLEVLCNEKVVWLCGQDVEGVCVCVGFKFCFDNLLDLYGVVFYLILLVYVKWKMGGFLLCF